MKGLILAALLTTGVCSADTIYVQFSGAGTQTGPAALPSGPNATWDRYSSSPSASGLALLDTSGSASGITMAYNSYQLYTSCGGCAAGFGAAYDNLGQGYLSSHSGSGSDTVTLTGFTANEGFDLYIYSQRDASTSSATFDVNGSSQTTTSSTPPGSFVLGTNYLVFTGTADGSGNVSITYSAAGSSGEGDFNGFQLVTAPEPGTLGLLLGGLACAGLLRRKAVNAFRP